VGFVGNVAFSVYLRFNTSLSFLAVVLISFGLVMAMSLILERIRGVHKQGRYMPVIEPPSDGESGKAAEPIV
jgi:hypothetical protein